MAGFTTPQIGQLMCNYAQQPSHDPIESIMVIRSIRLLDSIESLVKPIIEKIANLFDFSIPEELNQLPEELKTKQNLKVFFHESSSNAYLRIKDRIVEREKNNDKETTDTPLYKLENGSEKGTKHNINNPSFGFLIRLACNQYNKNKIEDSNILDRISHKNIDKNTLHFVSQGYCQGICRWIINLYLRVKNQIPGVDTKILLNAIWKEFHNGIENVINHESTLLQSMHLRKGSILGLNVGTQPTEKNIWSYVFKEYARPAIMMSYEDWVGSEENPKLSVNFIKQFDSLKPGVYFADTHCHAMIYIKISDEESYFIDPNKGYAEIDDQNAYDKAEKVRIGLWQYTFPAKESLPDNSKYISFYPVDLRHAETKQETFLEKEFI